MERLTRVLFTLSTAGARGADAERLLRVAGYGAADPADQRDQLRRDLRHLSSLGWEIARVTGEGETARYRLTAVDNRLRLDFPPEERFELLRAARVAGLHGLDDDLAVPHAAHYDARAASRPGRATARDGLAVATNPLAGPAESAAAGPVGSTTRNRSAGPAESAATAPVGSTATNPPASPVGSAAGPVGSLTEPVESPAGEVGPLDVVQRAVHRHCLLRFDYKGRGRVVHPFGVYSKTAGWYLTGREVGGDAVKTFALSRMSGARLDAPGTAEAPVAAARPRLDPVSWLVDEPVAAVLATTADHAPRVIDLLGSPTADTEVAGERQLTIPVTNRAAFRARLCELGARARLLGPPELREELRAELLAVAGRAT